MDPSKANQSRPGSEGHLGHRSEQFLPTPRDRGSRANVVLSPHPVLPEKRKPTVSCSKPKSERKRRTPLALKTAGGGPNPETTREMTEAVKNTDGSKTSTLTGRRQSAAVKAQVEGSSVEATEDAVTQVLEQP